MQVNRSKSTAFPAIHELGSKFGNGYGSDPVM